MNLYYYQLTNCTGTQRLFHLFSLTIGPGNIKEGIYHRNEVAILPGVWSTIVLLINNEGLKVVERIIDGGTY